MQSLACEASGTPTNAKCEHLIRVVEWVCDCSAVLILQKIGLVSSAALKCQKLFFHRWSVVKYSRQHTTIQSFLLINEPTYIMHIDLTKLLLSLLQ